MPDLRRAESEYLMSPEEKQRRAERRAERAARSDAAGPTPRNIGPKRTTTNVDAVKAAHEKRKRRAEQRLENAARTREGRG